MLRNSNTLLFLLRSLSDVKYKKTLFPNQSFQLLAEYNPCLWSNKCFCEFEKHFFKKYVLLISQSILWIVLNIISSADIFWLTSKIIFINLHPFHADILDPLLFLMTATDIPQDAKCDLYLFTSGSWLVCQHKYSNIIKKELNEDFPNICD